MPTTNQPVPPDAEIIFRAWLLSKTSITNLVGTRVATRLPRDAEMPFVTYQRAGGILLRPTSQVHMQSAIIPVQCFAGQWGGDGTTSAPDYGKAMEVANAIVKECFNMENEYVTTGTTTTRAKIVGFDIPQLPARVNEVATGLGRYDIGLAMMYRAV
tara:strand:+ start:4112 stop:4582 length:471 start_codon:yes stop_codon:yes gene_type:complete